MRIHASARELLALVAGVVTFCPGCTGGRVRCAARTAPVTHRHRFAASAAGHQPSGQGLAVAHRTEYSRPGIGWRPSAADSARTATRGCVGSAAIGGHRCLSSLRRVTALAAASIIACTYESRANLCDDNLPRLLMAEHHCSPPEAMQRGNRGARTADVDGETGCYIGAERGGDL